MTHVPNCPSLASASALSLRAFHVCFVRCSPREYTMKEIVELINKVTRKPNKTFSVPSKLALLVF